VVSGKNPGRQGAGHPNIVPYQPFEASNQPIIIAVGNDRQFGQFCHILDRPQWATDPAFATNAARVASRGTLVPMIAAIIAEKPAAAWLEQLEQRGIPAGPINTVLQALADPQAVHRGAQLSAGGGALGEVAMVGSPIRIDGEQSNAPLPPPALGEHRDLLSEWIDEEELARLRATGIVG
jgi:formyl-CoA transferase